MVTQLELVSALERKGYHPTVTGRGVELALPGAMVRLWPNPDGVLALGRSARKKGYVSGLKLADVPDFVGMFRGFA